MSSSTSLWSRMLAYCAASFGFTLLSSTFNFYYVKVFLNLYKIEESWFHMAQMLYLVWNAINDPLFAYWQDTSSVWLKRARRELILYTGPLFGLAYLISWFPWGGSGWVTGLHLIVALCLYDTMFTFIGLAMCCLYTEIAVTEADRIRLTRLSQAGGFIGSFSVTLCELTSNSLKSYPSFQMTTVFLAIVSGLFMYYCGKHAHTHYDVKKLNNEVSEDESDSDRMSDKPSYWVLTWQILRDTNFVSFVICNFLQEFHRAFIGSFAVIICDQLISNSDVPSYVLSFFYGALHSLNTIVIIFGAPLITRIGYFTVIRGNFLWKIISGIVLWMIGRDHPWLLLTFMLLDSCYTNLSFSLFNLPLSDVADNNMEKYNRKHPISSMVYGTNALVVKPSQSLCPMMVVAILNRYGYEKLKGERGLSMEEGGVLKDVMFLLVWMLPVVVGLVQSLVWSFYRLRHKPGITLNVQKS